MSDLGQMYRPVVDVRTQYGAAGDGITDDTGAFQAALESLTAGELFIPSGKYLVSAALIVRDGVTLVGAGPGASSILAAVDGMALVHHVGSNGGARSLGLSGNGKKRVSGLRVTPLDESQTATQVHQNYNRFRDLLIAGCAEGIVLQCGPSTAGGDSGCWYNSFDAIHVYYCTRGIWMKDGPNPRSSGVNRNQFFSVRVGQGTNTGLQIDSGDTNSFFGCSFEGISVAIGPSETPTAIKIASSGMFLGSNQSNRFFGLQCEGCTRDLDNANPYTEMFGSYIRNAVYTATPRVMLGGYDASLVPQVLQGLVFQTNGQLPNFENTAVALPFGRLQFLAGGSPSSGANTLDAYEEGVWKPVLNGAGVFDASYAAQSGRYVKIGRHVFIWGHIKLNAVSATSGKACRIDGLSHPAGEFDSPVTLRWDGLQDGRPGIVPCAIIRAGSATIDIHEQSVNGIERPDGMPASRLTATSEFHFSGQYATKD